MYEKEERACRQVVYKESEKVLRQMESDLEKFDRIFLVLGKQKLLDDISGLLCDSKTVKEKGQKILALALSKGWIQRDISVTYRQITEAEARELCRLYCMYEFSDRFQIISEETMLYGSIFQLVDAGLLSHRESVAALLQ